MVKCKQVVQVEAEPAVQVGKVKKLVKKRADPSDPEAPIGKDHPSAVDISDWPLIVEPICAGPRSAKAAALKNPGE